MRVYVCKICKEEFTDTRSIISHFKTEHNINEIGEIGENTKMISRIDENTALGDS